MNGYTNIEQLFLIGSRKEILCREHALNLIASVAGGSRSRQIFTMSSSRCPGNTKRLLSIFCYGTTRPVTHSRRRLQQFLNDARHTSYSSFSSTISDPRSSSVEKCT